MATGDDFTDGQISDPVAIGDLGLYHQTASTTSSFTVEVEFNGKLYTEHWVKYRAKVTANGNSYYSQEGIGPDPRVDTREGIPFTFKANVTGLTSGRTFIYTVQIQWYDLELSSDTWHDGGKAHKSIGATDGVPQPFNWQTTNYSRYHPELEDDPGYWVTGENYTGIDGKRYNALSYFNASAAQTQKAYNAVKNGGRTSDFSTRVWNDLMDRIAWVQSEWGIKENRILNRVWPTPYISDLEPSYKDKIAIGDLVVKTDAGAAGRAITAAVFNIATEAIPIVNTWPWEKELGRKKIMPNDICKGSYFLALVNVLNHWISLTPLPIVIASNIANQSMSGKMVQLPSVPIESSGSFRSSYQFTPDSIQAIQGDHTGIMKLVDAFEVTVENGVLPFASQFNFWDFDSSCKAAAVSAYVIGEFNGGIKQPAQVIDIDFASTLMLQNSDQIIGPKHTADLTAPQGWVIGGHSYTLHTQAEFQIGSVPTLDLEHNGIFGVVNTFTLTPKDNDQSVLEGTIGISGTVDEMLTESGIIMDYLDQIDIAADFVMSSSTGNVMDQDTQIGISGTFDFTASTIIPLELDGNVGMSATVDDMRIGNIYEIPNGSASVSIEPTSEVSAITTIDLGSTTANVGVSVSAENNSNSPIELTGDANASIDLSKSILNSQKDISISGNVSSGIKSDSEVNTAKYKIVDGSASVSIEPTSEVATSKPRDVESWEVLLTEKSTGEMVCRPFTPMPTGAVDIASTTGADMNTLNMARTRTISADTKILSAGTVEMNASKGQKEAEIEHVETISTEALMAYKVPTTMSDTETVKFVSIAEMDKSSGHVLENEFEPILVRSEAAVTLESVSLILASELDDTLVSELDDKLAYDAERIIRITENDDPNTK